jgi:hypothetical protein
MRGNHPGRKTVARTVVGVVVALFLTVLFTSGAMAVTPVTEPDPQSITPDQGARGTTVNPTITGVSLGLVNNVYLSRSGETDIKAEAGSVTASGTQVSFTLEIPAGAALGDWDVEVWEPAAGIPFGTNIDDYHGIIYDGFTITQSASPNAPVITSISPARGAVGTGVLISGKNFGSSRGNSYVNFGSSKASSYASWSSSQISCTVPVLDTGPVSVTVTTKYGTSNSKTFTITFPIWYLAEGSTAWGYSAYISIENPNDEAVTAKVTYMTESGPEERPDVQLSPMSQATLNPESDIGQKNFSTMVECREGKTIAVDRTMYWTGEGAASQEGHCSVGVPAPDTTWYLAEGSSEWGFDCWLLIQNPNDEEATCQVTYMIEGSAPVTLEKKVPGNSRKTYNMETDIGKRDASIKVESDIPVIPERAMYRNSRREGHDSIGTISPALEYYLAEGTTAYGFTTYILIQNPNDSETEVNLTYMTTQGEVQHPENPIRMPANSRKTVRVNDFMPGKDFSTRVVGSQVIIAERAMYWDAGLGEACHDSIGVSEGHKTFYLPDGQTSDGRETYTLVQNPNGEAVTVEVTYLTPDGTANVTFEDTVAANSRQTYVMADKILDGRASVMVTSKTAGKDIIVERAMYWNARGAGTGTLGGFED